MAGIEFDISPSDIDIPERCPVLGVELVYFGDGIKLESATLDRIDNTKGYVRGNVAVISQRANRIKDNATAAELRSIVAYMEGSRP